MHSYHLLNVLSAQSSILFLLFFVCVMDVLSVWQLFERTPLAMSFLCSYGSHFIIRKALQQGVHLTQPKCWAGKRDGVLHFQTVRGGCRVATALSFSHF